jgi:hypothetical protein
MNPTRIPKKPHLLYRAQNVHRVSVYATTSLSDIYESVRLEPFAVTNAATTVCQYVHDIHLPLFLCRTHRLYWWR